MGPQAFSTCCTMKEELLKKKSITEDTKGSNNTNTGEVGKGAETL